MDFIPELERMLSVEFVIELSDVVVATILDVISAFGVVIVVTAATATGVVISDIVVDSLVEESTSYIDNCNY